MQGEERRKVHTESAILFAAVFCAMFFLSLRTPLIADDFNYAFGYSNDTRISSLADVWKSMYWHRRMLNPRVFSHGWLSLVLIYPRWVFAALNAAVAVLFTGTTIGFLRGQRTTHPVLATAFVWMLLWICMPGFGQVFFWTSGACNYFWGIAIAWFIIWRVIRLQQSSDHRVARTCLLLLPAFASGAWSEHISFAMLMILFLIAVRNWVCGRRFPVSEAAILFAGCGGYLFMMLAPAAKLFQRVHDAGDPSESGNLVRILEAVPGGAFTLGAVLVIGLLVVIAAVHFLGVCRGGSVLAAAGAGILLLAALVFGLRSWRWEGVCGLISSTPGGFFLSEGLYLAALAVALGRREEKNRILLSLVFAFSGFCGFALFLFGEYFPIRGFCAPVTFSLLGAVFLMDTDTSSGRWKNAAMITTATLVFLCFGVSFWLGSSDILNVHRQAEQREADFRQAAAGNKIVVVTPYEFKTKYTAQYGNPDLSPDADWPNGVVADYYDVVRILVQ